MIGEDKSMNVTPTPPGRPRARALLDAEAQQRVGDAPRSTPRGQGKKDGKAASSSPSSSGGGARAKRSWRRPAGSGAANAPSKGSGPKVRVHSRPEPIRWSIGGLNISVRFLVALAIVGVLLATLVPLGLQWMKQEQSYRSVLQDVASAQEQNEEMRDQLDLWNNEDYVAAQARDRLGYVRPGETQFVVTDAPAEQSQSGEVKEKSAGPEKPWMWTVLENLRDVDAPPTTVGLREEEGEGTE